MAMKIDEIEKAVIYALFLVLVSIVGWLGSNQMAKLVEIEKELSAIKLELVAMQNSMLTEERVREIVKLELIKQERKTWE